MTEEGILDIIENRRTYYKSIDEHRKSLVLSDIQIEILDKIIKELETKNKNSCNESKTTYSIKGICDFCSGNIIHYSKVPHTICALCNKANINNVNFGLCKGIL